MNPEIKKQCEESGIPTTTDELLEWLPTKWDGERYLLTIRPDADNWWVMYEYNLIGPENPDPLGEASEPLLADALAKLALWVKEQE